MCGCGCGLALILAEAWTATGDPTKAGSPGTIPDHTAGHTERTPARVHAEDRGVLPGWPDAGWPSGSFGSGRFDRAVGVDLPRWLVPGQAIRALFAWPGLPELARRVHSRWRSLP